ncbi:hypothetical protein EG327_010091 [Venturia inaequalis]|uniref:Secreted protein n=1 Tax=Venturia inaequalis TaxID=5025 RepID=A0A8H3ZCF8_VENIN|nr:hypothetical protein EG327_010091 [Venturia inaequalis]
MKLSILTTLCLIGIVSANCRRVATYKCRTGCGNDCSTPKPPTCGTGQSTQDSNTRVYVERASACFRPGQTLPPFEYDVTRMRDCG